VAGNTTTAGAVLTPSPDVTGQLWTVIPRADGTVELRSDFTGPRRSLRPDRHQ
jgi:hypothetical protein